MADKSLKMPLNLQFFAEDEGAEISVNTSEAAEPTENVESTTESTDNGESNADVQTQEPEHKQPQSAELNAQYAAARRHAEAERDRRFAERFKGFTNPITGQAITSEADYFAALDAQDELNRRQQLEQQGIDPKVLDDLIANNPAIKQAQQILAQTQEQENARRLDAEMEEVKKLDPTVKSIDDVLKAQNSQEILAKINAGYSLIDAYKIVNFDKLTAQNTQASKQAAINAMRGKDHMTATGGVTDTSEGEDIPQNELAGWKRMFPEASEKELREKYNRVMKSIV